MKNIFFLLLFITNGIFAAPSVTVAPYPGIQTSTTNSPVIYFQVSFSEPVTGFDNSDLIVGGSSGANTGFINYQFLDTNNNQNFMVQVDVGGLFSGTVTLFIPSGVAISGGDANNSSNTASIDYSLSGIEYFSTSGTNFSLTPIDFYYNNNVPTLGCSNLYYMANFGNFPTNYRTLPIRNYTTSTVCVGITIINSNATVYPFFVTKSLNANFSQNSYLGGSYNSPVITTNTVGRGFRSARVELLPDEIAYIIVDTQNSNFNIYVDGLNSIALSNESFENNMNFKVFPNPSNGIFEISGDSFEKAKIYNTLGQLIYEGPFTKTLHLESLEKGTYLLNLEKDNLTSSKKIILK